MDNVSVLSHNIKMGGAHSHLLSNIAVRFWEWCLHNHLIISEEHLPGALNIRVNWELTVMIDSTERLEVETFPFPSPTGCMGLPRDRSV